MQFNQCNPPKKVQFIDSFIIELVSRKCKPDGVPARHCQRWNVFERSFFLKGHFFIDLDLKKKVAFWILWPKQLCWVVQPGMCCGKSF